MRSSDCSRHSCEGVRSIAPNSDHYPATASALSFFQSQHRHLFFKAYRTDAVASWRDLVVGLFQNAPEKHCLRQAILDDEDEDESFSADWLAGLVHGRDMAGVAVRALPAGKSQ